LNPVKPNGRISVAQLDWADNQLKPWQDAESGIGPKDIFGQSSIQYNNQGSGNDGSGISEGGCTTCDCPKTRQFDVVLGADIVYVPSTVTALAVCTHTTTFDLYEVQ
jgi:hypothetical protein